MDNPKAKRLREILHGAIQRPPSNHHRHGRGFLPESRLWEIVHSRAVENEISRCYRRDAQFKRLIGRRDGNTDDKKSLQAYTRYADQVCPACEEATKANHRQSTGYRKIMAILTLMDASLNIRLFVEMGVCDENLPLIMSNHPQNSRAFTLYRVEDLKTPLRCVRNWGQANIARFEELQWTMLAPCFSHGTRKNVPLQCIGPKYIMPFTLWEKQSIQGRSGQIYKVKIHSDHHSFRGVKSEVCPLTNDLTFDFPNFKKGMETLTYKNRTDCMPSSD